jgi:aspartyl/glutamyl-tRNA(Asn/Gln) amidotransferase C subunit
MISRDEVLKLAELARLKLGDVEADALQKDISSILDYVGQVSAVPAAGQKESPLNRNVMREDVLRPAGDTMAGKEESVRAAFPKREGNHNVVRKIIKKDE